MSCQASAPCSGMTVARQSEVLFAEEGHSMINRINHLLAFCIIAGYLASPSAATNDDTSSLCSAHEIAFLNARMQRQDANLPEKILSLCADSAKEPLRRMVYRFGSTAHTEIELVASSRHKAGLVRQADPASHSGLASIHFYSGSYTYEVGEGLGMTTGIRLEIYRHQKQIASYRSDDYQSTLLAINFDQPASPIFRKAKAFQRW